MIRWSWLWLAAAAGCASLQPLGSNVCGNGVIDPGEDCDTVAPGQGEACLPAGDSHECRLTCAGTDTHCPQGWVCGGDQICRLATETFTIPDQPLNLPSDGLVIGDYDGDGRNDLASYKGDVLTVQYGDGKGDFADTFTTFTDQRIGEPRAAQLDDGKGLDLIVPLPTGLYTLLGQSDKTLLPHIYSPFAPPDLTKAARTLPVDLDITQLGSEYVIMADDFMFIRDNNVADVSLLKVDMPTKTGTLLMKHDVSELADRIPVIGPLVSGLQVFVLPFTGETTLFVYGSKSFPVTFLGMSYSIDKPDVKQTITFADSGATVGPKGVIAADFDGDGMTDLIIDTMIGGQEEVYVARGVAGILPTFATTANKEALFDTMIATPSGGDGPLCGTQIFPLAAGDMNGDKVADYVNDASICTTVQILSTAIPLSFNAGAPWTAAIMGDFNGDGRGDVAAIDSVDDSVQIFLGSGLGIFNRFHVDTVDPPRKLRVGDFDGDYIDDVAVVEDGTVRGVPQHLAITYGAADGSFQAPVEMGDFGFVDFIETSMSLFGAATVDLATDLVVQSREYPSGDAPGTVAIMTGSGERRMISPYTLAKTISKIDVPFHLQVGHFLGSEESILSFAHPLAGSKPDATRTDVWLSDDDGKAGLTNIASGIPFPSAQFDPNCAVSTVADLDGEGPNRDLIVGLDNGCAEKDKVKPETHFVIYPITDPLDTSLPTVTTLTGFEVPTQVLAADLNGDQRPEIIVTWLSPNETAIYWNDAGTLDMQNPTVIPPAPGCQYCVPVHAVPLNGHADNFEQVALLEGLFEFPPPTSTDPDPPPIVHGWNVYIARLDSSKGPQIYSYVGKDGQPTDGDAVPAFATTDTVGIGSLYAADVNSDGLDDLIVDLDPAVYVLPAIPVNPK